MRKKAENRAVTLLFGSVVLAGLLAAASFSIRQYRESRALPGSSPPAEPAQNLHHGRYDYQLNYPKRFLASVAPMQDDIETVYLFPENTPPEDLTAEARYDASGVIRLEARPKKAGDPFSDLDRVKKTLEQALNAKQEPFLMRDLIDLPLPGFEVVLQRPAPLKLVFLEGPKAIFQFTAGPGNEALAPVLKSLAAR